MIYALSTWLTKLMSMSGYSLGSALSLRARRCNLRRDGRRDRRAAGSPTRFHIKWVLVTMYALGGLFLYLMTVKTSTRGAVSDRSRCGGGMLDRRADRGLCLLRASSTRLSIRSTGIGMAAGVGRLGAIAGTAA